MAQETTGKPYSKVNKEALAQTACRELMTYGLWDGKTKVKRGIRKYILRQNTAPEDLIFWPTGLLAAGLWNYSQTINSAAVEQALDAYYTRWMKKGCPVYYLDDLLAGETLLSAYTMYTESGRGNGVVNEQNADAYRTAIGKLADFGVTYPTDEMGSFPYRAAQNNGYVFVDAIGLACPFLYRYGTVYQRNDAMELAVRQIVNFAAYGMDGSTGLPYHGYVMNTGYKYEKNIHETALRTSCAERTRAKQLAACVHLDTCAHVSGSVCVGTEMGHKYGIIGWGRAVGWLLRGMIGCMISEYGAERLKDSYIDLVDSVLPYQHKDGYFSWQLQAMDGPVDTSATGMICAALEQGIRLHILEDPKYEQALQTGRNAIYRSVRDGRVYDCSGECEGFGQYPQRYGAYPWALGPALLL